MTMQEVGVANQLTLLRLALSPVFIAVFIIGGWGCYLAALLVAGLIELTDLLDGYIARSRKQTSDFGKLADPMADTVSRFSIFLCFLWGGFAELWVVALIFYRELIVAYIRVAAARAGTVLAARLSGKIKAMTQGIVILAILMLIVLTPSNDPFALDTTKITARRLMILIAIVEVWSGFDYVRMSLPMLRSLLRRKP